MYAITGITGQVGGAAATALLAQNLPVRAILRNPEKAPAWRARGCEIALAEMHDQAALTAAFHGAKAVFILPPSEFDPAPGFPEARRVIDALIPALAAARPAHIVCLSTIGADAPHENLLTQRTLLEQALAPLNLPTTILRPAWFMENAAADLPSVRDTHTLHSFLQPADHPIPMVATADVGAVAAELLIHPTQGRRIVNLEGPARYTPNDLAAAFAAALHHQVHLTLIPRAEWEPRFRAQGAKNPTPRIRMLDGFNENWITFPTPARQAPTTLTIVISQLVKQVQRV